MVNYSIAKTVKCLESHAKKNNAIFSVYVEGSHAVTSIIDCIRVGADLSQDEYLRCSSVRFVVTITITIVVDVVVVVVVLF